ncbi:hypothetical protein [Pyrococcus kukulkanii]|uniref:Uncharacterized protein n=1 Tax=Pyrococcus kukulkanii TaxID=1609559 RepID=A0ABV4T5E0_9EURY
MASPVGEVLSKTGRDILSEVFKGYTTAKDIISELGVEGVTSRRRAYKELRRVVASLELDVERLDVESEWVLGRIMRYYGIDHEAILDRVRKKIRPYVMLIPEEYKGEIIRRMKETREVNKVVIAFENGRMVTRVEKVRKW